MTSSLTGIHHVTAIASDPQKNVDFYVGVLGLRLVKQTVNFDDPGSYHFYYGDAQGSPGTLLTFFVWPGGQKGRRGLGQVTAAALSVAPDALGFWQGRLTEHGVTVGEAETRFGETVVPFYDPDGLRLELVPTMGDTRPGWTASSVPASYAIRGVHAVTLPERSTDRTAALLTDTLGFRIVQSEGDWTRYALGDGSSGAFADMQTSPNQTPGQIAVGNIHHVAWRTPDDAQQERWLREISGLGLGVSPVMDRDYFHSIYFREPGGILFEIATDTQGAAKGINVADLDFIHCWVPAPSSTDADTTDADTLLLLHGTGGDESDLLPLGNLLAPNANLLSLRGKTLEGGMPRFFRRLAEGVFDIPDLIARTHELADFVQSASNAYGFDAGRVIAVGFSNGANITASLLLLRPGVLHSAVLLHAMVPLVPETLPDLAGTRVFLGAGRQDSIAPPDETERLAALLRASGADVTLHWQPGGHGLTREEAQAAAHWLAV
jgi:glyoxalase family protein